MYAMGHDAWDHGNVSGGAAYCKRVVFRLGCEAFWRSKR
jgi:hypothetical protein